ncbi:MAG: DNA polymerase I [Planctomycetota bacterium]
MKTLFVIDGHSYIYHSFFGMPPLTNSGGDQVQAAYAFVNLLVRLRNQQLPTHWVVALDTKAPTFRHEAYAEYKANREAMPDPLRKQIPWIEQLLEGFGVTVLRVDGYEADDIVGTMAVAGEAAGYDVRIISKDKDLEQLLSERVQVWDPKDGSLYGPAELLAKKSLTPERVVEYLALCGDSSDNVPGVAGVGPKTAIAVLNAVDDVDRVFDEPPPDVPARALKKIREQRDALEMSRSLVKLTTDVPVDTDIAKYEVVDPDATQLRPLLEQLGFHKFIKELGPTTQEPVTIDADHHDVTTTAEVEQLVDRCRNSGKFTFDVWAHPADQMEAEVLGITIAIDEATTYRVQWLDGGVDRDEALTRLRPLLADIEVTKIAHDIKRQTQLLLSVDIELFGAQDDPMLASYLLNPLRRSYGLDALSAELLGHPAPPMPELEASLFPTSPTPEAAGERVVLASKLAERLAGEVTEAGLGQVYRDLELPLCGVLAAMEREGISLDLERLRQLEENLSTMVDDLAEKIHAEAGSDFNINSPKQLEVVLFDDCDFPALRKTKTGRSTSADVLEELAERFPDRPLPALILEYRSLAKLLNTYIQSLPRFVSPTSGRVHTMFSQVAAATGRLASSDPNLQNIPIKTELGQQIRAAFRPNRSGEVFVSADYSQIELRVLAHLCADKTLIRSLTSGDDIHTEVAAKIHGKDPADVTADDRRTAKAVNFGVIYGMGPFGLSRDIGISMDEAKQYIATFFEEFPGVREFIDSSIEYARQHGDVRTMFGRRRPIPDIDARTPHRRQQAERFAVNTIVQGTAADLIKKAMVELADSLRQDPCGARMVLQIHDELLLAVDRDQADVTEQRVRMVMEGVADLAVPLSVSTSIGEDWHAASK